MSLSWVEQDVVETSQPVAFCPARSLKVSILRASQHYFLGGRIPLTRHLEGNFEGVMLDAVEWILMFATLARNTATHRRIQW